MSPSSPERPDRVAVDEIRQRLQSIRHESVGVRCRGPLLTADQHPDEDLGSIEPVIELGL
jgi:hypothetical protein